MKTGHIYWAALCSVAYFYMVSSWGGYVFLINLIPMHVFVLMVSGRFSHRVYVAYSTVYVIGTILSMQISFVGFQPVQTSEHMMVRASTIIDIVRPLVIKISATARTKMTGERKRECCLSERSRSFIY